MDEKELNWSVTVTLFDQEQYDGNWIPEKLTEAVAWLQGFLEQVPVQFRDKATIEISSVGSYEDSHYAAIEISYQRPPTHEEKQGRLAEERQRYDAREASEREVYERLKAKYGGHEK